MTTGAPVPATGHVGAALADARSRLAELEACVEAVEQEAHPTLLRRAHHQALGLRSAAMAAGVREAEVVAAALEHAFASLAGGAHHTPALNTQLRSGLEVLHRLLDVTDHRQPGRAAVEEVALELRSLSHPGPAASSPPTSPAATSPAPTNPAATSPAPTSPVPTSPAPTIDLREVLAPEPADAPLPVPVAPAPGRGPKGHFLDPLLEAAAELGHHASRLDELARSLYAATRDLERAGQPAGPSPAGEALRELARSMHDEAHTARALAAGSRDELARLRLTPVATAVSGLAALARSLAARSGAEVQVEVSGAELRADVGVVDVLGHVLPELVSNAVVHGIGRPERRIRAGKAARGRVTVDFAVQGGLLHVRVGDDGEGAAAPLGTGAGGLADVRRAVEARAGTVAAATAPGRGTVVELTLPTGLPGAACVLVAAAGRWAALPVAAVSRLVDVEPGEIAEVGGRLVVRVGATPVPAVSLGEVLSTAVPISHRLAAVVAHPGGEVAVLADTAEPRDDVVVTTLPAVLGDVDVVAAAAIRADGSVAPLLSVSGLARRASGDD